jgi:hypothetical protein
VRRTPQQEVVFLGPSHILPGWLAEVGSQSFVLALVELSELDREPAALGALQGSHCDASRSRLISLLSVSRLFYNLLMGKFVPAPKDSFMAECTVQAMNLRTIPALVPGI